MNALNPTAIPPELHRYPIREVITHVSSNSDDIVWLAGTLVEGLGNETSDFDVYVVKPDVYIDNCDHRHHRVYRKGDRVLQTFDFMDHHSYTVDVYYKTAEEFRNTVAAAIREYQMLLQRTKISPSPLHVLEQKFVHRLFRAVVVQGADLFNAALEGFHQDMFCYMAYRHVSGSFPHFRDILGSWRSGDTGTCCLQAREFMFDQMRGFLHLTGETNPTPKWTYRLTQNLPSPYASLRDAFIDAYCRSAMTEAERVACILDCLEVADRIFSAGRALLDSSPYFQSRASAKEITLREIGDYKRWHPTLTLEFSYRARLFDDDVIPLKSFLDDTTALHEQLKKSRYQHPVLANVCG